jgi:hypothetical protein
MFSIYVKMTENVHGCIHILFRLNQEIHDAVNQQYPIFYEGTSIYDYDQAFHVMTCGNSVMIEKLHEYFYTCGKRHW